MRPLSPLLLLLLLLLLVIKIAWQMPMKFINAIKFKNSIFDGNKCCNGINYISYNNYNYISYNYINDVNINFLSNQRSFDESNTFINSSSSSSTKKKMSLSEYRNRMKISVNTSSSAAAAATTSSSSSSSSPHLFSSSSPPPPPSFMSPRHSSSSPPTTMTSSSMASSGPYSTLDPRISRHTQHLNHSHPPRFDDDGRGDNGAVLLDYYVGNEDEDNDDVIGDFIAAGSAVEIRSLSTSSLSRGRSKNNCAVMREKKMLMTTRTSTAPTMMSMKNAGWMFEDTAAEKVLINKSLTLTERLKLEFGVDAHDDATTSATTSPRMKCWRRQDKSIPHGITSTTYEDDYGDDSNNNNNNQLAKSIQHRSKKDNNSNKDDDDSKQLRERQQQNHHHQHHRRCISLKSNSGSNITSAATDGVHDAPKLVAVNDDNDVEDEEEEDEDDDGKCYRYEKPSLVESEVDGYFDDYYGDSRRAFRGYNGSSSAHSSSSSTSLLLLPVNNSSSSSGGGSSSRGRCQDAITRGGIYDDEKVYSGGGGSTTTTAADVSTEKRCIIIAHKVDLHWLATNNTDGDNNNTSSIINTTNSNNSSNNNIHLDISQMPGIE
ncbi:hypothetical protein HELRODRAFT_182557 [Helobdella robusta]|uniref:Uncharacterized protein n=1 Tax=Helobdella robusta TaxID=6412 RepID=T1FIC4_HELRO|nr:hypothetical protein HELRODRAFT_182557 [Helobdella robusta]ESN90849.1 hypothetical protein HELRODRAFT_182557 [Helobdella robusta]